MPIAQVPLVALSLAQQAQNNRSLGLQERRLNMLGQQNQQQLGMRSTADGLSQQKHDLATQKQDFEQFKFADERQRKQMARSFSFVIDASRTLLGMNSLERPAALASVREMADQLGVDLSGYKDAQLLDDNFLKMAVSKTEAAQAALKQQMVSQAKAGVEGVPTVEVGDPASPTGTSIVARKDVIGRPGKPSSGLNVDFDPETGKPIRITTGRGAGKAGTGGLQKSTRGKLEGANIKSSDVLLKLDRLEKTFDPQLQTIGAKWTALKTKWKDKAGLDNSPEDMQTANSVWNMQIQASEIAAAAINALSGAAVSEPEMKRLDRFVPNVGTGVFDGDSPQQLALKIKNMKETAKKILAKNSYILKHGFSVNKVSIDDMQGIMADRAQEIEREIRRQSPQMPDAELRDAIAFRVASEFGLLPRTVK